MNNKNVFLNEKVAKKLFKNELYGKILSAKVISDILNIDYDTIYNNIKLSSEEIAFSAKTLNSTADAIYYDDVHYFNIEVNFNNYKNKPRQLSSYTYQLYLGQIHSHNDYPKLKRIIQISLDSWDYFHCNEFMYYVYFMEQKTHQIESDDITKIHINLAYLQKLDYTNIEISGNKLMKDLYFLSCGDNEKLDIVYGGDNLMEKIIDEAKKIANELELDLYATDEEFRRMDQEEYFNNGLKEGIEQGIKQGIEQGILQKQKELVINFYNNKVPIEVIAKSANLTTKEVKSIIDNKK